MDPTPPTQGRPILIGCFAFAAIILGAIVLGAVMEYRHPKLASKVAKVSSPAYQAGLAAGKTFGEEERRRQGARLSPDFAKAYAAKLELPPATNRAEYESGWCDGYAAGYPPPAK
jgi:hypothetical protein